MRYLTEYQTFENKQQLNEALSEHISRHTYELNDTARDVLLMISRYAVKFPGAAHLKTATIAEAVGKTGRTVRRAISKLIELGIIEKLPFMREVSGGFGANIYRILSPNVQSDVSTREQVAEPCDTKAESSENAAEPISSLKQKDLINNTYYGRFKEFIHSTIGKGNQRLISRLYGVYKAHSTPLLRGQAFAIQDVEQAGWQALKAAVMATKSKSIHNLPGYYNGVLDRMLDRLYFDEMEALGGLPYST